MAKHKIGDIVGLTGRSELYLITSDSEYTFDLWELRGLSLERIKEKDQEINALQIAHVNQESDNMVLRKYMKEVYDVLDRYQAFQLSGKTEEERKRRE
jgi:hypothetical protein